MEKEPISIALFYFRQYGLPVFLYWRVRLIDEKDALKARKEAQLGETIIYVAGNPDLYPLEYYNSETMTYEGALPSLLASFSSQTEYQVRYYKPGEKDLRASLAKNQQVDLISGCTAEEDWENCQPITVFHTTEQGESSFYQFYVTEVAPSGFGTALEEFVDGLSTESQVGFVLDQVSEQPPAPRCLSLLLAGITALCLILAIAALFFRKKYKKYFQRYMKSRDYDAITGFVNKNGLQRWCENNLSEKTSVLYTLFYFRMDASYLERLNHSQERRKFLEYAAAVLGDYIMAQEIGARIGDEGIVLIKLSSSSEKDVAWVEEAAERIEAFSQDDWKWKRKVISVGIYPMSGGEQDLEEMIFYGWQAAALAKKQGSWYAVCSDRFIKKIEEEAELREDIKDALKNDELELYLQFYADSKTMKVVGGEALVRWDHPERGLLEPSRFIPLLEQEGMIPALDYYCLEKVCRFLDELTKRGIENFFISCNFSRKTFSTADFVQRWEEIVGRYEISRNLLVFELTESILPEDRVSLYNNMMETHKRGIRIFLDDFGEGFTSFYDLSEFPVDAVKLDKHLADQVNTEKGRAILKAMVDLGHKMGLQMYVEGVEDQQQVEKLQQIGCDVIQGFFFHFPAPLWDIKQSLASQDQEEREAHAAALDCPQDERPRLPKKKKEDVSLKTIFAQIGRIFSK